MHDLTIIEAIFLGLLQGFTEWLPVSSSGHLVIFQSIFGISVPPDFDIVIMAGTIIALLVYFRKKITDIFFGIVAGDRLALNYFLFIIIAGLATGFIGFAGKSFFKTLFGQPFTVSLLLIVTGIFLFIASRPQNNDEVVTAKSALLIGIAQGLAVAPGISRSGSTIGTALILGVKPKEAAEFSFIIGIPAMIIASVVTFMEEPGAGVQVMPLVAAIIAAFIAGYISIDFFMKILAKNQFIFFAYYCIIAGSLFALLTFH
jgi:undecaprenyl-diphosphatase